MTARGTKAGEHFNYASHVAERVASELGEQKLVGYSIRGESRKGSHVEFCTTGVLLRRLEGGDSLAGESEDHDT